VTLGLPWLEAMARAQTGAIKNPVRMAFLFFPNGVNVQHWYPKGEGREFELSPTLAPLEDYKQQIQVLSHLWNASAKGGDGHYAKDACFLTSAVIKKTPGVDLANATSVDQVAAQRAGDRTPLPSIELGVAPVAVGVDLAVGYTRIYGSHISWANANTPLPREVNPKAAYERLYRAGTTPSGDSAKMDRLLLDRVLDDAKRLKGEVGSADGKRIDEYLSVMRSLEQRAEKSVSGERKNWKAKVPMRLDDAPTDRPSTHQEHCELMLDVIATAFQTDSTRLATFMFGNSVSDISFRFLEGITMGHHDTSHHAKNEDKLRQYQIISQWHVQQYARLLGKLKSMKEGDSTVLDNSMIVFGSALSDGDAHSPHKLPIVVGGGGGGRLDTGQHRMYTEDTPLSNLYVSLLDAFGTPVERFADSTGPLPGVLRA
jgi:hypothetical protein